MKTLERRGAGTNLLLIGIALIVWNTLMTVLGLWQSYWWAALFGNFLLIVCTCRENWPNRACSPQKGL